MRFGETRMFFQEIPVSHPRDVIANRSMKAFALNPFRTRTRTNLDTARTDDLVNLEFDLIAKYLERMLDCHVVRS
jgi:riboflavin synthase alpha subunit